MRHQGSAKGRLTRLDTIIPLLTSSLLAPQALSAAPAEIVAADALVTNACFSLGSAECTSPDEAWQAACSEWHRAQAPEKTTHIVITDEQAPGLTAFLGVDASVTAEYFDCGRDGKPGENSPAWLALQEQAKKREQWLRLLEDSRNHGPGKWQVAKTDNSVTFTLPASRASDTNGASYRVALQCSARSLVLNLTWSEALDLEQTQVIERFGVAAPESRVWFIDEDGLAAAHPLPDKALWQLLSADKYAVRTMPRNAKPSTAFFEPAGLAGVLEPYLSECGLETDFAAAP